MSKAISNKKLLRTFYKYIRPHYGSLLLVLLLLVIATLGALASPYALKIIIDSVFPNGDMKALLLVLGTLVVIYIIRILCTFFSEILYARVGQRIIASIQADMHANILRMPISFFKQEKPGDIVFTITEDVGVIESSLFSMLLKFAIDAITLLGIVGMLLVLDYKLAGISLLVIPPMLLSLKQFAPHLQKSFRKIQEIREALNTFFLEKIRNHRVIKSYNTYRYETGKLSSLHQQMIGSHVNNTVLSSANSSMLTFFVAIGPIIVLMFGGAGVFRGALTIGELVAFIQYLNRIYAPALTLAGGINSFNKALVSMQRIEKFLQPPAAGETLPPADPPPAFSRIEFRNVSLKAGDQVILQHVNLQFERGKITGIIGPSGAGKSTIVNLLCGFIQPDEGDILLDGQVPVRTVSNWSDVLGLIEKEHQLFHNTILENIRYGSPQEDDARLQKAVLHAGLATVLNKLPGGMDTIITESGATLSDGQKQRISIARAMFRNAGVIILDEATSSLDMRLEKEIIHHLRSHYGDAAVVFITHRMASLQLCDCIYAIHNGAVSAAGPPEKFEDPRKNGVYEKDIDTI